MSLFKIKFETDKTAGSFEMTQWSFFMVCMVIFTLLMVYNLAIKMPDIPPGFTTTESSAAEYYEPEEQADVLSLADIAGVTYTEKKPAKPRKKSPPVAIRISRQDFASSAQYEYVKRFADLAVGEQVKYGIPASIKLAQGILESGAGGSALAVKNNNHFGIKCFRANCPKGHCTNYADDSHKDFFRNYGSAWESWRNHSERITSGRYAGIKAECKGDFKCWARGLKAAGYATSPTYSDKLISLIEDLQLWRFDNGAIFKF